MALVNTANEKDDTGVKKRIEANNIFVCEVHLKPDCILTCKLQRVIIFAYIYFALDIYIV